MNQRAQGEVTIREALRELDLWGAGAVFALTDYEDSNKRKIQLIKDWKDLVNAVSETGPGFDPGESSGMICCSWFKDCCSKKSACDLSPAGWGQPVLAAVPQGLALLQAV